MAETMRTTSGPIALARRPLYAMLLLVPVICFLGALLTDLSYLRSDGNLLWLNFSSWLIATGLLFGGIALLVAVIDTVRGRRSFLAVGLLGAAWVVELINAFIHTRDGWTAVAGTGLILSIIGVALVLISGWLWQSLRYDRENAR
ncbi:MAG: DUF2231 domain-containing protein [Sphingomicrobium sp.]